MLVELAVTNLGVIDELSLVLGPGLTALTGETGAGKTLLVEAIELLVGGRADPVLVRPGATEARVEGRFLIDDDREVVLARVIPAVGRSRAYVDGRLAPAAALSEWGEQLVDLHGQHAHQSLLGAGTQRAALDRFGAVDLEPLLAARAEVAGIDGAMAALGGDDRARAREIDLLRFQVAELEAAALDNPDEELALAAEDERLANAIAHREGAAAAVDAIVRDGGAADSLATAIAAIAARPPFGEHDARLRSLAAELTDTASDLRHAGEAIEDDPDRLAAVQSRRQLLRELRRKYGETITDVIAYAAEAAQRLASLESHEERAAALGGERVAAAARADAAAAVVGDQRRSAAPRLAELVGAHLGDLAMTGARLAVDVGADPGDDVTFLLAANKGGAPLPLAKVASGGELARAMLALRLVMLETGPAAAGGGPTTLVFDEVDAGIGGAAATAVGHALAALAAGGRQVLVVTHLPHVAAFADTQIGVAKRPAGEATVATAAVLGPDERVVELSRMLSGSPDSSTARTHAAELLDVAARARPR